MGPTLWSSDLDIFGQSNPEAVEYLSELYGSYTDLGSHLDMLHESPCALGLPTNTTMCIGCLMGTIRASTDTIFRRTTVRGSRTTMMASLPATWRVKSLIRRVSRVTWSLMSGRVCCTSQTLETTGLRCSIQLPDPGAPDLESAERDHALRNDGCPVVQLHRWIGLWFGGAIGLALVDDILFVTDNETSEIVAFDMDGEEVDRLNTGVARGSSWALWPQVWMICGWFRP